MPDLVRVQVPYVSDNPGYHWARMLGVYAIVYLGASGHEVGVWER